jgi:hypothetical protein
MHHDLYDAGIQKLPHEVLEVPVGIEKMINVSAVCL